MNPKTFVVGLIYENGKNGEEVHAIFEERIAHTKYPAQAIARVLSKEGEIKRVGPDTYYLFSITVCEAQVLADVSAKVFR